MENKIWFFNIASTFALLVSITSTFAAESTITVETPWVRQVEAGMKNSAAYFTLKNSSDQSIDLLKVASQAAATVEIHNHVHLDGAMKMERVEKVTIAPKSSVEFKPMGYHVMLIGLSDSFKKDKKVALKLSFSDGSTRSITAEKRGFDEHSSHSKHH
ncbi:MAG: copper chaperone PCu(A)C [Proteobacteria bacterium]|nr:MAG: copper chaperone PCu(A)C [Pseudomonadota bacterium]